MTLTPRRRSTRLQSQHASPFAYNSKSRSISGEQEWDSDFETPVKRPRRQMVGVVIPPVASSASSVIQEKEEDQDLLAVALSGFASASDAHSVEDDGSESEYQATSASSASSESDEEDFTVEVEYAEIPSAFRGQEDVDRDDLFDAELSDLAPDSEPEPSPAPSTRRPRQRRPAGSRAPRISAAELAEKNLIEWHPELHIDWDQLKQQVDEEHSQLIPALQPTSLINVKLLPFQREGLAWLVHQEDSEFQGGILSDAMGMGKTLQTISLLLCKPLDKPTLVVCPVVAIIQWMEEIAKYTPLGHLKVLMYHGTTRTENKKELLSYDIILTTYAILESAFRKQQTGFTRKGGKVYATSTLHSIQWGRIVLDEAHSIKDRSCSTARAAFALNADKKWSLSGTPLQNRVGELYSLIRFLRVSPFSNYYCKKCPCKTMVWKFSDNRHCDECGHKPMQHFCWWNKVVLKPIQRFGAAGEGLDAFKRLGILLDRMMLRRTKQEKAEELGLPPKLVDVRRDYFNPQEEDFYQALYSESQIQFESYVRAGTVLNNYAHIFELLSKLRQAADHPFLVVHKQATQENPGTYVCGLCHDIAEEPIAARCKHVFCREDIRQYLDSYAGGPDAAECPLCFTRLHINLDQPELALPTFDTVNQKTDRSTIVDRMLNAKGKWSSSTKIEALLEELDKLRREDHTIKSIVFSQFTAFLDLLHWRLRKAGFHCVKLDGRMTPQQRDAVIKTFMTVPQVTVFLVSLKAGGVALNLTEASRVFLMDPWWNPATENQAMDRIHRLGQYRPVRITRLIVENSIESRIVQLQEKKELLFQSTVGKDAAALERLSEDDLRFLFQN